MAVIDNINNVKVSAGNVSGPASYATGGFELDLSATFSFLGSLELAVETLGSLMPVEYEITLNRNSSGAFAQGKAMIKLTRVRYDKATIGNVSGNPGGTTVQASKTATGTTTGSSHTHAIDHNHPSVTSSTPTAGGDGVNAAIGQPAISTHTHDVDLANFTGNSGSQTHTHDRSFEYDHNHSNTQTSTNGTATEVASTTNLSTTTWRYFAIGF